MAGAGHVALHFGQSQSRMVSSFISRSMIQCSNSNAPWTTTIRVLFQVPSMFVNMRINRISNPQQCFTKTPNPVIFFFGIGLIFEGNHYHIAFNDYCSRRSSQDATGNTESNPMPKLVERWLVSVKPCTFAVKQSVADFQQSHRTKLVHSP